MTSTLFTIGTALNRARDHGVSVRLLVSGHWIEGGVSDLDGHGVVLTGGGNEHHVVRIQDISAITVQGTGDDDASLVDADSQQSTAGTEDALTDRATVPMRVLHEASGRAIG